jgi:hypothetical protein
MSKPKNMVVLDYKAMRDEQEYKEKREEINRLEREVRQEQKTALVF